MKMFSSLSFLTVKEEILDCGLLVGPKKQFEDVTLGTECYQICVIPRTAMKCSLMEHANGMFG